jgi:U3 small nucleolar RNA-associated protein 4
MSQRQSFRAHKADGMCMVIGPGGRTVFTSGPDQRVCQFTAMAQANGSTHWALTATKRLHTHDVRALAIFPSYVPIKASSPLAPPPLNPGLAPILASGGWDMAPVLTPAAAPELLAEKLRNPLGKDKKAARVVFEEAYSRKLPMFGGERAQSRISMSRGGRLVVGRKDRSVGVWRVEADEDGWTKVLEMDLKLRTNLLSSAVSQDGQWLAVSDLYETKLFRLRQVGSSLHPVRVRDFVSDLASAPELEHLELAARGCGASALLFTPDSGRLVLALAGSATVVVVELPAPGDDEVTVVRAFAPQHALVNGRSIAPAGKNRRRRRKGNKADSDIEMDSAGSDDEDAGASASPSPAPPVPAPTGPAPWVTALSASDDGQYLATSDLGGKVTLFNLDTLQLHALLPTLASAPVALVFAPTHPLLLLVSATNTLQFYHLDARRLLPPTAQLSTLNSTLRGLHAAVEGAVFEPSRSAPRASKLVLFAHDWLATARLDLDLVTRAAGVRRGDTVGADAPTPLSSRSLRRKRAREAREQLVKSTSPSLASSDVATPVPGSPLAHTHSLASSSSSLARTVLQPSSANDPNFVKIVTDRFRAVVAVDWLADGELALVERPYADFVGELPPAFWTGSYGRA